MPLYEYKCDKCNAKFEVIQKLADAPMKKCPQCGGSVKKVISAPALQFKGSGFYINDYAKKEKKPAESKTKTKTAKDIAKETAPSEKKPEKETASPAK
ncbi:FmdB family zinc ribbon protein [Acidobacteriota bacterium]